MGDPSFHPGNIERFSGFADRYDAWRPKPPPVLVDLLCQLAQAERPQLVVDLGSGTGLSTGIWADRSQAVIGVEPSDDMRRQAEARFPRTTHDECVRYIPGDSSRTGLANGCADIVTCSQSLHWMEPEPTLAEVARLLRLGGVFAAYDCDWPPIMNWEAERAFIACFERAKSIEKAHGADRLIRRWAKREHLARLQASGYFCYTREVLLHSREMGHAERLVGLALSQGGVATLLKMGVPESEIGLDHLRDVAQRVLGDQPQPWYFCYRVRVGIK